MSVTRFAPSPTGYLHLGHAFSAWFAREHGERLILRIEDIDPTRCRPEFVEAILEDLRWLGLDWRGPVRVQSRHMADYSYALGRLRGLGVVYPCFCTRKDVERAAGAPQGDRETGYPGTCRALEVAVVSKRRESGEPFAWRLDVEKATALAGPLAWHDEVSGRHEVTLGSRDDFVVARRETPTSYHLSVVVDDALQGVTLVTRGIDLAEATASQRLLQALLGLPEPRYLHHRLVVGVDGKRLAKRDQSVTIRALREAGWGPDRVRAAAAARLAS